MGQICNVCFAIFYYKIGENGKRAKSAAANGPTERQRERERERERDIYIYTLVYMYKFMYM